MTTSLFSKLAYKLMALFVSIIFAFTPYTAPTANDPIKGTSSNGSNLTFVAWADPQISNYMAKRYQPFNAACEDLKNTQDSIDALVMAGDLAENGLLCEYEYIIEHIDGAPIDNYLIAVGNHDIRLRLYKPSVEKISRFTNNLNEKAGSELKVDSLHYSYEINGYRFIVLGTDKSEFEESYLSNEQLSWLDSELQAATADNTPAFVVIHQTFKLTHGLPDTWNSPIDKAGTVGEQSDKLYEVMNKYRNVFLITGHLHTGIGEYTYERLGNINSVNLPSLTITNKDGKYNDNGIGFMVEVYDTHVLFRARDFAKGIYIPDYDIDIPLDIA